MNLRPHCLLLVEDDPLVRLTVAMLLEDHGFRVTQAATADDAINAVENGLDVPVLITDVDLGAGLNGPQLADRLREVRPDLLVVFITGRPASVGARTFGPREALLPKPFEAGTLAALVNRMVAN